MNYSEQLVPSESSESGDETVLERNDAYEPNKTVERHDTILPIPGAVSRLNYPHRAFQDNARDQSSLEDSSIPDEVFPFKTRMNFA